MKALLVVAADLLLLALWFGLVCGLAGLAQVAAEGLFGHALPFWPTAAAVVLFQLVVGGLTSTIRSK